MEEYQETVAVQASQPPRYARPGAVRVGGQTFLAAGGPDSSDDDNSNEAISPPDDSGVIVPPDNHHDNDTDGAIVVRSALPVAEAIDGTVVAEEQPARPNYEAPVVIKVSCCVLM